MIIALDFDNTIHDTLHPVDGRRMGPPLPGAADAIQDWVECGHTLIIFTCRSNANDHIGNWLRYYNLPAIPITNMKPIADVYVDDRAVGFRGDWTQTAKEVGRMLSL